MGRGCSLPAALAAEKDDARLLDHLEPRKPQDDDRREDPGRSPIIGDVHGGHEPGRLGRVVAGDDLAAQPLLETDGLLRGDVPVVKAAGVHGVKRQVRGEECSPRTRP